MHMEQQPEAASTEAVEATSDLQLPEVVENPLVDQDSATVATGGLKRLTSGDVVDEWLVRGITAK